MRLTSWLSLISNTGAARRGSSRLSRRPQRVSLDRLETLEDRLLLTARYVDNPADYTITNDTGAAGLSAGDTVTWNGATPVAGLIFGTTAFSTIQSAVTFATAGDTINVAAGTYAEAVAINKSLTLLGAQSGVNEAGRTFGAASESTLKPNGGSANLNGVFGVFNVSAANVTIDGFSVGVNGAITGPGGGIYQSSTTAGYTVKNNIVNGFAGRIGINVAAGASNASVRGNRVENGEPAGLGVYFSNGATGEVVDNTITGTGDGVFLEGANTINITSNTFANLSGVGIGIGQFPGVQNGANIAVTGNEFNNVTTIVNNDSAATVELKASSINGGPAVTPVFGNSSLQAFKLRYNAGVPEIQIDGGAWIPVSATEQLQVYGLGGNDTFEVDFTGGNPIPTGGLLFDGGAGGNDALSIIGNTLTSATLTHTNANDGTIVLNGRTLTYLGLDPITINTPGANWVLEYATDAAPVTLAAVATNLQVTRAGVAEEVTINPAGLASLTVRTGTGADTVELDSLPAGWTAGITIDGQGGADILNVNTATVTSAGALSITGIETVNLANDIAAATITGTATTVNVLANTAQIQDGIALAGTGATINIAAATYTGNVNATGGGKSVTLAPVGTGTVTLNGNLDLNAGDALQIQIAALGTLDNFIVNGTVTLGGATLATSLLGGFVPIVGDVFQIVTNDAADAVSGTFAGLAEGSVIILGSTRLKVSYIGGSGNDITLTALPPAVAVSFSNGNLVVTGTGNVDDFTIQVSGTNQVTLIGNNGTNFTGAGGDATTVGPFLVTGQLTVSTGNGNDIVHLSGNGPNAMLDSGNVSIDLGAGNDTLTQIGPSPLRLTGNLSVVGGTGSDTVALGLTAGATDFIVANLTIDNGTDDNAATQSVTLNGLTANGNVTVTNSGNALQSVVLGAAATVISGNLKITQSGSANTLGYSVVADNAPVGGSVTITNGNTTGSTLVDWATSNVGGSTVVTNGNATGNNTVLFTSNVLTGSATVKNGNAAVNSITVDGSTLNGNSSSFTNGSATTSNTINLGLNAASTFAGVVLATNSSATGANSIIVQRGSLNGGATLSNNVAGAASNTVTLGNIDTVSVVGNLSINNANSTTSNNVNVDQLLTSGNKSGDVSINNGTSNTTNVNLGATISNTIAGNLTVRNQATVGTRTTNVSRTTVNGGSGFYLFNVGAGNSSTGIGLASPTVVLNKLKIEDGSGTAALNIRAATLGSLNFMDMGGGADTVDIAGNGGVGVVTINGVTRIDTGAASDLVRIGTTGTAVFNDSVFILLGAGDDTLTIGDNASSPAFSTASKLSFDGGAGVDSASISTLSVAEYELVAPNKLSNKLKQKIKGFETLT